VGARAEDWSKGSENYNSNTLVVIGPITSLDELGDHRWGESVPPLWGSKRDGGYAIR
jgi:hypothetical protein